MTELPPLPEDRDEPESDALPPGEETPPSGEESAGERTPPPPFRHGRDRGGGSWAGAGCLASLVLLLALLILWASGWSSRYDPALHLPEETMLYADSARLDTVPLERIDLWREERRAEVAALLRRTLAERIATRFGPLRRLDVEDLIERIEAASFALAPARDGGLRWIAFLQTAHPREMLRFLRLDVGLDFENEKVEGETVLRTRTPSGDTLFLFATGRRLLVTPDADLMEFALEAPRRDRRTLRDRLGEVDRGEGDLLWTVADLGALRRRAAALDNALLLLTGAAAEPRVLEARIGREAVEGKDALRLEARVNCAVTPDGLAGEPVEGLGAALRLAPAASRWVLAFDLDRLASLRDTLPEEGPLGQAWIDRMLKERVGLPLAVLGEAFGGPALLLGLPPTPGVAAGWSLPVAALLRMGGAEEARRRLSGWIVNEGGKAVLETQEGLPLLTGLGEGASARFAVLREASLSLAYAARTPAAAAYARRLVAGAKEGEGWSGMRPEGAGLVLGVHAVDLLGASPLAAAVRPEYRWGLRLGREGRRAVLLRAGSVRAAPPPAGGGVWSVLGWILAIVIGVPLGLLLLFLLLTVLLALYFYLQAWWRGELSPVEPPRAPELSPEAREDLAAGPGDLPAPPSSPAPAAASTPLPSDAPAKTDEGAETGEAPEEGNGTPGEGGADEDEETKPEGDGP